MINLRAFASVLSVAALLAGLAAPLANAATSVNVIGVKAVNVSATSTDYKDLGDVKIKVTVADLNNEDFFFLRLPSGFKLNIPAATDRKTDIAGAKVTKPDGSTKPLIKVVGGVSDPWNDGAVNHLSVYQTNENELKVVVKNAAKPAGAGNEVDTTLKISLGSVYVPGNADTAIQAVMEGKTGSAFGNDAVTIANRGVGLVTVSVDSVKTIPEGGTGTLDTIRFKEDIPGALAAGSSLRLKLPYGFEWVNNTYAVHFVDGDSGAVEEITAMRSSYDSSELEIKVPATTTAASYFTINQAAIEAKDSTTADFGEIVLAIAGSSSTNTSSLVVGKYAAYSTMVEAQQPKVVLAGRVGKMDSTHTEIGQLVLHENAPGSMRAGGTIRLELTGGVKWAVDPQGKLVQAPQIAASLSDLQGLQIDDSVGNNGWELVGSSGDTIQATIKTASNGAKGSKIVLEKGLVDIPVDAVETDVHVKVGGSSGVSGDAGVIAKVVMPVSMTTTDSFLKPVQGGVQNQAISDIVVKENVAGAIDARGSDSFIRFTFESGIQPIAIDPSQVQVGGDLVLDQSSLITKTDSQGHWYIQIPVKSASTVPSSITLSGVRVTVDRTVPEGALDVMLTGSMLQTETDKIARVTAANVIIPTNGNVMKSAVFVIGSASYTVNGEQKTSDAAPFIDKNGRTQLPVRAVAEAFGAVVGWDPEDQTVSILKDGKAISITVGSWVMNVGGVFVQNDSPAINKGGRVYLPIRIIAEALGANVGWDPATQTVYLN